MLVPGLNGFSMLDAQLYSVECAKNELSMAPLCARERTQCKIR